MAAKKRKKEDNISFIERPSVQLKAKEGFFILLVLLVCIGMVEAQELDKKEIGEMNVRLLFSSEIDPGSLSYTPGENESLYDICRKFNMCPELMREINGVSEREKFPKTLKIVPGNFSIIIERGVNALTVYRDGKFFKEYKVATGRNFSTPAGEYWIMSKLIKPPWIWKDKAITPENPEYPLGTRWMGLSGTRIGIHGTKDPEYIGQYVSSGCIRMINSDIEQLFKIVPFGTKVTIVE